MPTAANTLKITAQGGAAASDGIFMRIRVLSNARVVNAPVLGTQSGAAAHEVSIIPAATNSIIHAATINAATTPTVTGAGGAQSASATYLDSINGVGHGAWITSATTAGTAITMGVTESAAGGVAALEVASLNGTSAPVDTGLGPNQPNVSISSSAVTSGPLAPPPGSLVVAMVTCAGSGTTSPVAMHLSDSYGLAWTCGAEALVEGDHYAAVWYAPVPVSVSVATTALADGTVGFVYYHLLEAINGYASYYRWYLATGSLPPGLQLRSDGILAGVPSTAGTYTFTVTAYDAFGFSVTSVSLSLTIAAAPPAQPTVTGAWHGYPTEGPYFFGCHELAVANVAHDWLFVSASWLDTGEGQAEGTGSIVYVSDDAHNVYQEASYNTGGIHTQIFAVPNAAAATKVFVATSTYVDSLQVCAVNVHGLGPGYVVDGSLNTSGGPSSTFTMSKAVTSADFVFAAGAYGGGAFAISQSGTGGTWHAITAGANNDTSQVASWTTTTGAGTVAMTYGDGGHGTGYYSGGLVAVKQSQPAPVNSNPAWPVVKVQAAFGFNQQSPVNTHQWTDITSRYQGISGNRGRDFELNELSAADLTLTLDNYDGALSPGNASSPFWPNVTLMTPVRVLAIWQGRYHYVLSGTMLAIPQTYDFQRGVVKVNVSDDYCKLPQILLGSCMIEEVLFDKPLDLWPLNEQQGSPMANNWSGRSTAFLVPVNGRLGGGLASAPSTGTANISGFPYPGSTGFGQQNGDGKLLYPTWPSGLQGTQDTVWGNIGGTPGGKYFAGTGLINKNDRSLPWRTTGATYEVWACVANVAATRASQAVIMMLSDDKGTNGSGVHFRLRLIGGSTPAVQIEQASIEASTSHTLRTANLYDAKWHHYALTIATGGTVTVYVDGTSVGSFTAYNFHGNKPTMIQYGGDSTVTAAVNATTVQKLPGFFTGFMSTAAVFDRVLDQQRIAAHFESGRTGFDQEYTGQRIQRVLTYANWFGPMAIEAGVARMQMFNYLNTGGYASSGLTGSVGQFQTSGGAAIDSGSQSDMVISDVALSENAFLWVSADGTLSFRSRQSQYSLPVKGTLGDMDYALNSTSEFNSGSLGEWTNTTNCTVAYSTGWSYAGGGSALMTVTGYPNQAYVRGKTIPVNSTQGCTMIVMSPQGAYVGPAIDWYGPSGYISTTSGTGVWCPPYTPVRISVPATAPPTGATGFLFGPSIGSGTNNGTQVYLDRPRASVSGFAVPYEADLSINLDVQYLYNDVTITRNLDQSTYRAFDTASKHAYYPRTYTRVLYTSPADIQAIPDSANWLLSDYSTPRERVEQLSIIPSTNPEAWEFCLSVDVGDIVKFTRTPAGGFVPTGVFIVLSIEIDWEPDTAKFTYVLAPNPQDTLVLDDPAKGVMHATAPNRLGW